jgi:hypothetical protein
MSEDEQKDRPLSAYELPPMGEAPDEDEQGDGEAIDTDEVPLKHAYAYAPTGPVSKLIGAVILLLILMGLAAAMVLIITGSAADMFEIEEEEGVSGSGTEQVEASGTSP